LLAFDEIMASTEPIVVDKDHQMDEPKKGSFGRGCRFRDNPA